MSIVPFPAVHIISILNSLQCAALVTLISLPTRSFRQICFSGGVKRLCNGQGGQCHIFDISRGRRSGEKNKNSLNKVYTTPIQHVHVYINRYCKMFCLSYIIIIHLLFVHKYSFNVSPPKSYSIRNVWERFRERKTNQHKSLNAKMFLSNVIINIHKHLCHNNRVRTWFLITYCQLLLYYLTLVFTNSTLIKYVMRITHII